MKLTRDQHDADSGVDIRMETSASGVRVLFSPRSGRIVDESCLRPGAGSTGPDRPSRPYSEDYDGSMGLCEVGHEGRTRRLIAGLRWMDHDRSR